MAIKEKTTFSFPNMFDIETGKTKMISGLKATNSNMGLLLRTSVFDLFGDPAMGSKLVQYLFLPDMELLKDAIIDHLKIVLENQQKDITVMYLGITHHTEDIPGTLHIEIDYHDNNTGQNCKNSTSISLDELKLKEATFNWDQ